MTVAEGERPILDMGRTMTQAGGPGKIKIEKCVCPAGDVPSILSSL